MDEIDLLYYALDILDKKETNDLDKEDIQKIRDTLHKLIRYYLCGTINMCPICKYKEYIGE